MVDLAMQKTLAELYGLKGKGCEGPLPGLKPVKVTEVLHTLSVYGLTASVQWRLPNGGNAVRTVSVFAEAGGKSGYAVEHVYLPDHCRVPEHVDPAMCVLDTERPRWAWIAWSWTACYHTETELLKSSRPQRGIRDYKCKTCGHTWTEDSSD